MRFLIDENLPVGLVKIAEQHHFKAAWVRDLFPGAKDHVILKRLNETKEILVTRDIGFANMIFKQMNLVECLSGVVLIREQKLNIIYTIWDDYLQDAIAPPSMVVLGVNYVRVYKIHN
ncbi:MAG: DUF5615 family PIN-like protein [bacterium]